MPRLFVDNLTVIDCSILDPERGLIGASWIVDIELHGELDEQSMVFDFAKVKKTIKRVIDDQVDHKLLIPAAFDDTEIQHQKQADNETGDAQCSVRFTDHHQQVILHQSPASAITLIPTTRVGREAVVEFLDRLLMAALPENVREVRVTLTEEQAAGNYYCYSHGLKKHDGNCQRIAHGHRSQVQIWKDGERDTALEQSVASRWQDIYLGTREDIQERSEERIQFAYQTEQGDFMLELPADRVHLMHNDSTVECIAEHLQRMLSTDQPEAEIRIKAFEGIGKGAIA
ncbi:MAG: 6-carboxytetrahydropterin synthase [Pseudomonadota bacterium]